MIWISILYKYSVILLIYFFNRREDLLVQCWGFCIPFTLRLFLLRKVGTGAVKPADTIAFCSCPSVSVF